MWSVVQSYAPYACVFFAVAAITAVILLLKRKKEVFSARLIPLVGKFDAWGFAYIPQLLTAVITNNWIGKDSVTEITHEIIEKLLQQNGLVTMVRDITWKGLKGIFLTNQEDWDKVDALMKATPRPTRTTPEDKPVELPAPTLATK